MSSLDADGPVEHTPCRRRRRRRRLKNPKKKKSLGNFLGNPSNLIGPSKLSNVEPIS